MKQTISDYLSNEDTVLNAALEFEPKESLSAQLIDTHERGGINAALIMWSRYRTDPTTAELPVERAGNELARHLLDKGELRYAAGIFLFNREFHPRSIDAYLGEAEARHRLGDSDAAIAILEQAHEMSPDDDRIPALVGRIE